MPHGKAGDFDLDSHDLGISAHRSDPIDRYLLRASPSHTQARLCHLPPRETPLPVQSTAGSRQFHLFGDSTFSSYRDEAPRDGIDDARAEWLRALAVRFAPWLVRNSIDFPMDFRRFVEAGDWSTLFLDAVDLSQARPRLVGTETLEFSRLADRPCSGVTASARETVDTTTDCRLLQLVQRFAAEPAPAQRVPRSDLDLRYYMYFDFPGEDPASWNREFEGSVHG